ncbi:MAG: M12 family metallopeptidase, partial [Myxococcota bacterium]
MTHNSDRSENIDLICIDDYPDGEAFSAYILPFPLIYKRLPKEELALDIDKKWKQRQLRIQFLDGSDALRRRVKAHALEWTKYANIEFVFEDYPDAEIRVSFKGKGCRSMLGTDALKRPSPLPTMQLGQFHENMDDTRMRAIVLHEFGHVLACVHEHASPTFNIPWDKEKVYAYYKERAGWSKELVDLNVLNRYTFHEVEASARHDPDSIMQYPIDQSLTVGNFEIDW